MAKAFLLITLVFFLAACGHSGARRPTNVYFPEGYIGWVRIEYGVPGKPALPEEWRLSAPMA